MDPKPRNGLVALVVTVVTVGVWLPLLHNGFINYDDTDYVTRNPVVLKGLTLTGLRYAFGFSAGNWHPLTWLSHMADVELFGMNPAGHHAVSLLLHTATTLLLALFLLRTTGAPWRSLLVALLFGLHPLRVESVAWVAERKDVLSALFWFLTLNAYVAYVRRPGRGRYLVTLACFTLGLMAKPMMVTLPVVLLLLDLWPLGRSGLSWRRLAGEKLPLAMLAAGASLLTWFAQQEGGNVVRSSLLLNAGNALQACIVYLGKMVWPAQLAIIYPFDPAAITPLCAAGAGLLLAGVTWTTFRLRRTAPWVTVGWLWYLVVLLPVSGIVRIGYHAFADRYTYLPLTGIFILLVWGGAELTASRPSLQRALALSACSLLAACALLTRRQIDYWRDSVTLFRHTVAVTRNNYIAHTNLGSALAQQGETTAAIYHYREAIRIRPDSPNPHVDLGNVYLNLGYPAEALPHYDRALALNPGLAETHFNRGLALITLGRRQEAAAEQDLLLRRGSPLAQRLAGEIARFDREHR
jgi:tetratricopeptide (TPR) repeat protein